jgi:hypothetical protein
MYRQSTRLLALDDMCWRHPRHFRGDALERRQDKWECPSCAAGEALPPPRPRACTLREKYLGGAAGVELARITGLWKDPAVGKAGFAFCGQWYERPENTHCGRQARPRTLRILIASV